MDYQEAVHQAAALGVGRKDLAGRLSVSMHLLNQAMMSAEAQGYRRPPRGWRRAAVNLMRERASQISALADALERDEAEDAEPERRLAA
jgi:hypothetical protein